MEHESNTKYMTEEQFIAHHQDLEALSNKVGVEPTNLATCILHINELKSFFENPDADLFLNEYVLNRRRRKGWLS